MRIAEPPIATPPGPQILPIQRPAPGHAPGTPPKPEPLQALGPHLTGIGAIDIGIDHGVGQGEDKKDISHSRVDGVHGALRVQDEPQGHNHVGGPAQNEGQNYEDGHAEGAGAGAVEVAGSGIKNYTFNGQMYVLSVGNYTNTRGKGEKYVKCTS